MIILFCLFALFLIHIHSTVLSNIIYNLTPHSLKSNFNFISPIIGLALLLIIIEHFFYWLNDKSLFVLFLSTSILIIFIYQIVKKAICFKRFIFDFTIFSTIAFLTFCISLLIYGNFNPFNDIYTYLSHAKFLTNSSFNTPVNDPHNLHPYLSQIWIYQTQGVRTGGSYLLTYFSALTKLDPYYIYPALISYFFASASYISFFMINSIHSVNRNFNKYFIILIISIMPSGLSYGLYSGFFPQTIGLSFAIAFFATLSVIFKKNINNKISISLILSIFLSSIIYSYSDYVLFLGLALLIFFIYLILFSRENIYDILKIGFLTLIFSIFFLNFELVRFLNFINVLIDFATKQIQVGWPVFWLPTEYLTFAAGLKSGFINIPQNIYLRLIISIITIVVISLVIYFAFKKTSKENRLIYVLLFSILISSLVAFIKSRYTFTPFYEGEVGHSFLQLKAAKYASPFLIIIIFSSLTILMKNYVSNISNIFGKYTFKIVAILCSLLIFIFQYHNIKINKNINNDFMIKTGTGFSAFMDILDYQKNHIDPNDNIRIFLDGRLHKIRQMITYILPSSNLVTKTIDDGYLHGYTLRNGNENKIDELKFKNVISHADVFYTNRDFKKFGNLIFYNSNVDFIIKDETVLNLFSKIFTFKSFKDGVINFKIPDQYIDSFINLEYEVHLNDKLLFNDMVSSEFFVNNFKIDYGDKLEIKFFAKDSSLLHPLECCEIR